MQKVNNKLVEKKFYHKYSGPFLISNEFLKYFSKLLEQNQ